MTFACAIAPLDQSVTQLGWHPGSFTRSPCPMLRSCVTRQEGLQFLADAGTPVVAPFDARVMRTSSGLELVVQFDVPRAIATPPVRIRVAGVTPAVSSGPVQKGALLGRVARASRPAASFELVGGSIVALFTDLGLDVVGSERPRVAGYSLVPSQGGRLLVRASGPANCGSWMGMHGLEGFGLGADVAPAGYVEPDSGVYDRFGPSRLSNANVSPPADSSSGSGWSLLAWLGVGAVALWAAKR